MKIVASECSGGRLETATNAVTRAWSSAYNKHHEQTREDFTADKIHDYEDPQF